MDWKNKAIAFLSIALGIIGLLKEEARPTAAVFIGAAFVYYLVISMSNDISKNDDRLKSLEQTLDTNQQLTDIKVRLITTEKILESFINGKTVVKEARRKWTKR